MAVRAILTTERNNKPRLLFRSPNDIFYRTDPRLNYRVVYCSLHSQSSTPEYAVCPHPRPPHVYDRKLAID